jgi:small subunit ribosomal protein S20
MTDAEAAQKEFDKVSALLSRLGRKNIISSNKASNLKSKLQLHINKLAKANA